MDNVSYGKPASPRSYGEPSKACLSAALACDPHRVGDEVTEASPSTIPLPIELVNRVHSSEVVFFLGAGCSMEPPAKLPSAQDLADYLVERGHGETGDTLEQVAEACHHEGLHTLSEALPKAEWRIRPCNLAHRVIAELAKEGLVNEVVTTNWDVLIERGLSLCGVPFTPVVNWQALREGGLDGGVRVAKLQGCIDHQEVPLRATRQELREWAAAWAETLFEYLAMTRAFVFVGYSGAAESVSVTLRELLSRDEDITRNFAVDPSTYDEMTARELGQAFLASIGDDQSRLLQMTASEFFTALRAGIYPLLLSHPLDHCRAQLHRLFDPTEIDVAEGIAFGDLIADAWRQESVDTSQEYLHAHLPTVDDEAYEHRYVPIIPNAESVAQVWTVTAVLLWARTAQLVGVVLGSALETGLAFTILVAAAGVERRDVAGIRAVTQFVRANPGSEHRILCVVLGDMGPLAESQHLGRSVARPHADPSVARPVGPRCAWASAASILTHFSSGASSGEVMASVGAAIDSEVGVLR